MRKIYYHNKISETEDFFVVQVLNSKLGITLRVSVTSATILTSTAI